MAVHPVTNPMPGTEGRGDTSALAADAAELLTLAGALPVAAVPNIAGTNTTDPTAHTATTAIAATYDDLAGARTSVNTLRTNVETALGQLDTAVGTLQDEVEVRLDAIETKLNALLAGLRTGGIVTP
jgi:hypothetical protein